jgi:ionotropic glutamate receptor
MVLVNSYAGTIVSYILAITKMIPPINTMEDLASSEDVGMILLDISVIGQQIMARAHLYLCWYIMN